MNNKLIHQHNGKKTFVLIFDTGDEVTAGLADFARHEKLAAGHFTAIGALNRSTGQDNGAINDCNKRKDSCCPLPPSGTCGFFV